MAGIYDVTEALSDLLEPIVVKSSQPGSYVDGKWTVTPPTTNPGQAAVMPATPADEAALSVEGRQGGSVKKFYTEANVQAGDNSTRREPDVISYGGRDYRVFQVQDWVYAGGFRIAFGERI